MMDSPKHPLDESNPLEKKNSVEQEYNATDTLSTETPLEEKAKPLPPLEERLLSEVFHFGQSDLNANRMGRVSSIQQERLLADFKQEMDSSYTLLTVFLGVSVFLALIFSTEGLPIEYFLLGAGVFLGAFAFYSYRRQTKKRAVAQALRPKFVVGEPAFKRVGMFNQSTGASYWVIKDQSFPLDYAQTMTLVNYAMPIIKVYYLPENNFILSAEIVRYLEDTPPDTITLDEPFDEKAKRDIL